VHVLPHDVQERYRRSGAWGPETLVSRLDAVCARAPDRIALIDGDTHLTFAEFAARVGRIAGHLRASGVQPGDVVSWQLPNRWEAAVVHHAALRAGAIPNPLNPTLRALELRHIVAEARPRVFVTPAGYRGFDHLGLTRKLAAELSIPTVIGVGGGGLALEDLLAEPVEAPEPSARPADLALLLYTSGTTSAPKGVLHTHRSLLCEIDSFALIHRLTPDDRYLCGPPVSHIAGLAYGLLAPFALGTSTVLLDRWEPSRALASIAQHRITFMTGPPTFLQTLADDPAVAGTDLSSFRLFSTGGASIHTAAVRRAGERLRCVVKRAYGSTEVPTLTAGLLDDDEVTRLETDGRAIGDAEIRIVDGEIWARAPEMLVGYRNAALDPEVFADDGWFRTGDLGRIDEGGRLRVTGRLKDIIIRGGENISALELETLLAEHPGVSEVAVAGYPDERLGERVCAFVVPRAGHAFAFDDMIEHMRARAIATHKLPERLELRTELPKNANGKVLKDELRASLAAEPLGDTRA